MQACEKESCQATPRNPILASRLSLAEHVSSGARACRTDVCRTFGLRMGLLERRRGELSNENRDNDASRNEERRPVSDGRHPVCDTSGDAAATQRQCSPWVA